MQIISDQIHMLKTKHQSVSRMTLDNEYNVPDRLPDIYKVILEQGELQAEQILQEKEKMTIKGIFKTTVLYAAVDQHELKRMEMQFPIEESIALEGIEDGDIIHVDWNIEDLLVSIIHSRKVNVQALITYQILVEAMYDEQIAKGVQNETTFPVKTTHQTVLKLMVNKKDVFRVKEEWKINDHQDNISEIVWQEVKAGIQEIRPDADELLIKGVLWCFVLFKTEKEGQLQWSVQKLPFEGTIDCSYSRPDQIEDVDISLSKYTLEIRPDADGEERMFQIEAVLDLAIRLYTEQPITVMTDAYSLVTDLELEKEPVLLQQLIQNSSSRANIREEITLPQSENPVLQICHVDAKTVVEEEKIIDQGILAEGVVMAEIVYMTIDDKMPINKYRCEIPFTHLIETTQISKNCQYRLKPAAILAEAVMRNSREIQLNASIDFRLFIKNPLKIENITQIKEMPLDTEKQKTLPSLVGYIVGKSDGLWDIAKKYYTTVEKIKETNNLTGDDVKAGEKLLVVRFK